MEEIKQDLKEIKADVGQIKETLAVNTASLVQHELRTRLAEKRIEKLEYALIGFLASVVLALISHLIAR